MTDLVSAPLLTVDQMGVSSGGESLEAGIADASAWGASWVELACQHRANRPHLMSSDRTADVRALLAEAGLRGIVHSDSAVNTAEEVPVLRDAVRRDFDDYLSLCQGMGADRLIVHAGLTFSNDPRRDIDSSIAMLGEWARAAASVDVVLVLENMNVLPVQAEIRYLGCTGDEVREILQGVGSPALRACADLGHAHLLPGGVDRFLREVRGLVGHVQITDNDGVNDDHLAIGAGTLDVAGALGALRLQGYSGAIAIELDDRSDRAVSMERLRRFV